MELKIGRTHIKIQTNPEKYTFSGDIDEMFLGKQVPHPQTQNVQIDLKDLKNINSMGVREWINLMKDWADIPKILFENCSINMMDQFNIIPQMLGRAELVSFQAPYFCTHCDEEVVELIECQKHRDVLLQKKSPEIMHHCGKILDFDALEDSYFRLIERFLNT